MDTKIYYPKRLIKIHYVGNSPSTEVHMPYIKVRPSLGIRFLLDYQGSETI